MTDDELRLRIQRMYSAIGDTSHRDIDGAGVTTVEGHLEKEPDGSVMMKFGNKLSDAQIENFAWNAIHQVAIFFEHCEVWGRNNGASYAEIEAVRRGSKEILIIQDLHNSEKHPSQRANQSGVSPKITHFRRALRVHNRLEVIFRPDGGLTAEGEALSLVIFGEVVNSKTNVFIGELTDFLGAAMAAWEKFLVEKRVLTLPPVDLIEYPPLSTG